ncbi:MAG: nucleotidyltransferase domain-containing protein [Candidatus Binatia bacterium]
MARGTDIREIDGARPREIAGEVAKLARSLLGEDTQVIWFGSWPRGKAVAHSDIDVAVSVGTPIPLERMALLHDAVDDLATLYEIDLLDLGSAGPALRDEVLKHGERL